MPGSSLVRVLATSFLSGEAVVDQVFARGSAILGRRWRWLRPLAQRYVEAFALPLRPRRREVVRFLLQDAGFRDARYKYGAAIGIEEPAPAAPAQTIPAHGAPLPTQPAPGAQAGQESAITPPPPPPSDTTGVSDPPR